MIAELTEADFSKLNRKLLMHQIMLYALLKRERIKRRRQDRSYENMYDNDGINPGCQKYRENMPMMFDSFPGSCDLSGKKIHPF